MKPREQRAPPERRKEIQTRELKRAAQRNANRHRHDTTRHDTTQTHTAAKTLMSHDERASDNTLVVGAAQRAARENFARFY